MSLVEKEVMLSDVIEWRPRCLVGGCLGEASWASRPRLDLLSTTSWPSSKLTANLGPERVEEPAEAAAQGREEEDLRRDRHQGQRV